MPKPKKQLTPQQQGAKFEGEVSKPLHALVDDGKLSHVHKWVNCNGTAYDFEAWGRVYTYGIECKALMENAANKPFSIRLSCLTDNEWSGMRAWIQSPWRKAWVVWKSMLLTGEEYVYAVPFGILDQARLNGVKHLSVTAPGVVVLGQGKDINIWKLFARYEQE
jgi:hypothetical protein